MKVKSDIGQFGIIPRWVIDRSPTSKAIHLLAVLACKYADREGQAYPSRKTLARDLGGVHEITVDRAIHELEEIGVLAVERNRLNAFGSPATNLYTLTLVQPPGNIEVTTPGNSDVATPGNIDVDLTIPIGNQNQEEPPSGQMGLIEEDRSVWPTWYAIGYSVPGWTVSLGKAEEWRLKEQISVDLAERKAYALKDWFTAAKTKAGRKPYLTWQNWCRADRDRPAAPGRNGSRPGISAGDRTTEELKAGWDR
tara:strand:- start:1101 stop:1856 length:756 start_codon:yes stop_codon:yes gene_type:complete